MVSYVGKTIDFDIVYHVLILVVMEDGLVLEVLKG